MTTAIKVKILPLSPGFLAFTRWASLFLLAGLVGCGRNDVEVYRVAKEPAPAQPAVMPSPSRSGAPEASMPGLQWKLPLGWQEVPPGAIRVASFKVVGSDGKLADVSVVPLPGQAGSDLDNVNRWRGQVNSPPVTQPELSQLARSVEIGGQSGQLYEQAGANTATGEKNRILAAILRREGIAWFFKMTGDDALVSEQKPAFVGFLKSLAFGAPAMRTELPPSHPLVDGMSMAGPGRALQTDGERTNR